MSIFTTIETDIDAIWDDVKGSKVAAMIDNLYNSVVAELETVGVAQLETAVETIGVAALTGMSGGVEGAIAAGIAAAPAAFEAAGKAISTATIQVLTTGIATQLQAQGGIPASITTIPGSAS